MSGELEAAGAAVTAGLAAGAIERAGDRGEGQGGACPNCATPLAGAYCHACGQPADISRTLGDVVGDFLHAFLHFDTKAWRTLPQLVIRPGTMTRAYIYGHRARYVSPLALFLFTIFVMFFVFSLVGGTADPGGEPRSLRSVPEIEASVRQFEAEREEAARDLAAAEKEAAAIRAAGGPGAEGRATGTLAGPSAELAATERLLREEKARLAAARARAAARDSVVTEAPTDGGSSPEKTAAPSITVEDGAVIDGDDDRSWQDQVRAAAESGRLKVNFGDERLNERVRRQFLNPDLAVYKLQETAYKYSWLLVPITLPFIAFLFLWKRGVTLFDHVVFSLYSLSFMSLLFVALALLSRAGSWIDGPLGLVAVMAPPAHIFFHLKGTYTLGWWSALWRTLALLLFILFAIALFAAAILLLGLFS